MASADFIAAIGSKVDKLPTAESPSLALKSISDIPDKDKIVVKGVIMVAVAAEPLVEIATCVEPTSSPTDLPVKESLPSLSMRTRT